MDKAFSSDLNKKHLCSNDLFIFIISFAIGIVVHGYRFFNPLFSHDSMLIYQDEAEWQISLGRFLQPAYLLIRGKVCAPMLIGIASIAFFALSAYILIRILEIEDKVSILFICAILLVNPSFSMSAATYIDWLDIYMLCGLLNITGIYLCKKYRFGIAIGALLIAASLALYQAYIQISVAVIIILVISSILNGDKFRDIFLRTFKFGIMLLAAAAVYFIAYKTVLKVSGVIPAESDNGMENSLAQLSSFDFITVKVTAIKFISQFFIPGTGRINYHSISYAEAFFNIILFLMMLGESIFIFIKEKIKIINIILFFFVLGMMPLALNVSDILSGGQSHILTIYSFNYVYVLAVAVMKNTVKELPSDKSKTIIKSAACILLACLIWKNAVYANQLYLKKDFDYQNTLSVVTKMTERMETVEDYIPGETPVAFIGYFTHNDLFRNHRTPFEDVDGIGSNTNYSLSLAVDVNLKQYLEYVLAYPIKYVSDEEAEALANTEEVKNMPVYPSAGSIMMTDGVLTVRLS